LQKARLEAFSDGVLAVAITLLVLDLKVDTAKGHRSIGFQLSDHWPTFAAYGVSFLLIGTIWVNHHALFALVARVDRPLMFYNLLLLMFVATIPFTTATYAGLLRDGGGDTRGAVLLYGASMTGMSIGFTLILARIVRHDLLLEPVFSGNGRRMIIRFGVGALVYPASTLISLAWPPLVLIVFLMLAVYYMFEQTPILGSNPHPGLAGDLDAHRES
jgi:uncharacterized membrane protein